MNTSHTQPLATTAPREEGHRRFGRAGRLDTLGTLLVILAWGGLIATATASLAMERLI